MHETMQAEITPGTIDASTYNNSMHPRRDMIDDKKMYQGPLFFPQRAQPDHHTDYEHFYVNRKESHDNVRLPVLENVAANSQLPM